MNVNKERKRERETKTFSSTSLRFKIISLKTCRSTKKVKDKRHQSYITYGPETILYTILLKSVFGIKSMRSMTELFNKDECIENIRVVLGLKELNELRIMIQLMTLAKLEPKELETIRFI